MGCGSSDQATSPGEMEGGAYDDDFDFNETRPRRDRQLKVCSGVDDGGKDDDGRDDDYLERDANEPHFFKSGQICEPDNHNEVNNSQPDAKFELEYVYGYRAIDSRQNIYFNKAGEICYFTAAMGVVMDTGSNSQRFFGGGEVDCTAKNVARDTKHHTDDIMCMDMCSHKEKCVTGQVGNAPVVHVWNSMTGEGVSRMKLPKRSRGVAAVGFSEDNSHVACVDLANEHHVYVFKTSGTMVSKANGDTNKIKDVAWSRKAGSTRFATAGTKHFYFWDASDSSFKKRGIFSGKPQTSFSAVVWDSDDCAYTAGANGAVYKWGTDRICASVLQAHKKGCFVSCLALCDGKLYSGSKDKTICVINPTDMSAEKSISVESMPRAIDFHNGSMVCGMRNGTICVGDNKVMQSHCDGEVWGLDFVPGKGVVTSADDNRVMMWDHHKKCCTESIKITDRKANAKRGGASTMANNYDSQQSRAVAVCGDWLAFATNDGAVTIRKYASPHTPLNGADDKMMCESTEWIECMAFSPDGTKLAVGSHDNKLRVYDCQNDFGLIGTMDKHSSYICALDWSQDGCYIRTNSGDYELLFTKCPDMEQDPDGMSNTKGMEWATNTVKVAWHVGGIWPRGVDGTHINGVNSSPDGSLLVTADDYGLVSIYNNPARPGADPRCYRGHSEHVVRAKFCDVGQKLFSIGGYDQTLMQWNKC